MPSRFKFLTTSLKDFTIVVQSPRPVDKYNPFYQIAVIFLHALKKNPPSTKASITHLLITASICNKLKKYQIPPRIPLWVISKHDQLNEENVFIVREAYTSVIKFLHVFFNGHIPLSKHHQLNEENVFMVRRHILLSSNSSAVSFQSHL